MNDVTRWKVHGPVRTLRTEFATWNPDENEWQPAQHSTLTSFRDNGAVSTSDTQNPDGSIAHSRWLYNAADQLIETNFRLNDEPIQRFVYSYDEAGRRQLIMQLNADGTQEDSEITTYDALGLKTTRRLLHRPQANISYGIEGTDHAYGAPGAAIMITTCDENSLPAKVLFQDTNGHSLREVTFVRDAAGRLVKEEMRVEPTGLLSLADNVPEESRAEFAAMLAKTFGETFSRTTYEYDPRGRRLQRNIEFGSLSESRTTYQYDDHDDPISETTEDRNRELSTDDEGKEHYSSDRESVQQHRFEYIYDGHGNWTERIVQHSNVERRSITYY